MISNQEILNRFDVLYNNITSNQAPGLDGYEVSVFWNKATLEILKNHLNPKGNKYGEGFDGSPKRQIDFSNLICTLVYVFKAEDTKGSFNTKALRYGGTEKISTKTVTRYHVEYVKDEEDEDNVITVIHPQSESMNTLEIEDKGWPSDILSIINENVEVINQDDWNSFSFYLSKFLSFAFDPQNAEFVFNITAFTDWMLNFGFAPSHPVSKYLTERLLEAMAVASHPDYKDLDATQLLEGVGFSTAQTYDEVLSELNILSDYLTVVPLNNIEYDTLMSRPYKYPPKQQAWRIITNGEPEFIVSPNWHPVRYYLRYLKVPADVDLTSDVQSEVPEILWDEILQRAVELAKNSWEGNIETEKAFGERSE